MTETGEKKRAMSPSEILIRQALAKYRADVQALSMDVHGHVRAQQANAEALAALLGLIAPPVAETEGEGETKADMP